MHLINTETLDLEEYVGEETPLYAILSHTWQRGQELSLREWQALSAASRAKSGYAKIVQACSTAKADGYSHVWIDTVCIDKTSSAELSEAINSMFAWYRGSAVCYVFLADVPTAGGQLGASSPFCRSRWFTRGWTLQELLAPERLVFFASDWEEIVAPPEDLRRAITEVTGIEDRYLVGLQPRYRRYKKENAFRRASISKRMSWAADRSTTRVEDRAYSLLGIFEINMPLMYGEGPMAFLRLQEEIIKVSNDHTILCWEWEPCHTLNFWSSVLAPSPELFAKSARFRPVSDDYKMSLAYSVTNAGLSIQLPVVNTCHGQLAMLDAYVADDASIEVRQHEEGGWRKVCLPLVGGATLRRASFPPLPFELDKLILSPPRSLYLNLRRDGVPAWSSRKWFEHLESAADLGFYVIVVGGTLLSLAQDGRPGDESDPQNLVLFYQHRDAEAGEAETHRAIANVSFASRRFEVLLSVSRRGSSGYSWKCETLDEENGAAMPTGHEIHMDNIGDLDRDAQHFAVRHEGRKRFTAISRDGVRCCTIPQCTVIIGKETELLPGKTIRPVYIDSGRDIGDEMARLAMS